MEEREISRAREADADVRSVECLPGYMVDQHEVLLLLELWFDPNP